MEKSIGKMLSVSEAAKAIGLSRHWIHNHIDNGTLPFPHREPTVGKFLIDSADIDEWMDSIKVPAGKSLADHLQDMDLQAEDKLVKVLKDLSKKGKLNFLFKIKEAV
jgi:excisionase family DNA binding protein